MLVVVHPDGPHGPYWPSAKVRNCSMLRLETRNRSLRKAFRENNEQPLKIGFDYKDLVLPLPLDCEWEEIPEAYKAHIYPTLEKVDKGYYEDLIETWRKGHSNKKTGQFKTTENEQRYAMKDNIKAGLIPFKTDQEILDEIVPSDNRQNMSNGQGRYRGVAQLSQRANQNRQQEQEKELHRKQAEEAQARAYLASLKADAADQRANVAQQNSEAINAALGQFFMHYNSPNSARPFNPPTFSLVPPPPPGPMPQLTPNWAHLLQPPFPFNQPLQPPYTGPLQPPYTGPLQPLQPPYTGPFPITPVTNNNFNNCYRPVLNSTHCVASSSNSQAERPRYILQTNPHMNDLRNCEQLAQDLARENNNESSSGEEEEAEQHTDGDDDYSDEDE
ncbi:hypothetical protein Tco_0031241 [Tanacetum coccineum]